MRVFEIIQFSGKSKVHKDVIGTHLNMEDGVFCEEKC